MRSAYLSHQHLRDPQEATRREKFLSDMEKVIPWQDLCAVIAPYYPKGENGRPPVGLERVLPIYFLQQWFNLNTWPPILRQQWEVFSAEDPVYRPLPPSPEAVDRMLETMRWVLWLEEKQRHLVWMRTKRYGWRDITIRFACDRTTAWRRWQRALAIVAGRLNDESLPNFAK